MPIHNTSPLTYIYSYRKRPSTVIIKLQKKQKCVIIFLIKPENKCAYYRSVLKVLTLLLLPKHSSVHFRRHLITAQNMTSIVLIESLNLLHTKQEKNIPYIRYISIHENSRVSNIQQLKISDTWPRVIALYIV